MKRYVFFLPLATGSESALADSEPSVASSCGVRSSPVVRRPTNEKPRRMGGAVGKRCRLLLAPTRCGQTGEAEAEKGEGAGFGGSQAQPVNREALAVIGVSKC